MLLAGYDNHCTTYRERDQFCIFVSRILTGGPNDNVNVATLSERKGKRAPPSESRFTPVNYYFAFFSEV